MEKISIITLKQYELHIFEFEFSEEFSIFMLEFFENYAQKYVKQDKYGFKIITFRFCSEKTCSEGVYIKFDSAYRSWVNISLDLEMIYEDANEELFLDL